MMGTGLDTIFTSVQEDSVPVLKEAPIKSLFENHLLQDTSEFTLLERITVDSELGFVVLLICAIVIIYLQRNSDGIFNSILRSGFDWNITLQEARVENSQRTRNLFLLQVVALVSISLFVSNAYVILFEPRSAIEMVFLQTIGVVLAVIFAKRIFQWLLAQIFDIQSLLRVHRFSTNLLLVLTGLLLLPLSIFLLYSPQIPFKVILTIGIIVSVFFYFKSLLRGFRVSMESNAVSALHLFYYFCALELLPVFVFVRLVQSL